MSQLNTSIFPSIENEICSFQFGTISPERKAIFTLIDFIQES
jgi:arsenate reductase